MFIHPTNVERITSGFRPSNRKNHHGVDFAQAGTHEIFSIADGTVSRSYTSASYGECIMIVHSVDGQTWESVYAHMRDKSRKVKVGDNVKQGQVIGIMGNTGHSTGQHLHFELHRGRWNINKTNAVDPIGYLTKFGGDLVIDTAKNTGKVLQLPKTSDSWRVYPLNKAPVKGNEKGFLNPKKFGGLTYDIIGNPQKNVYTIKTSDFGTVNIYAAPSTGAKIVGKQTELKVGKKVKIKSSAKKYSRSTVSIPAKHKNKSYTIEQVGKDDVLIKELYSWVEMSDVE